MDNKDGQSIWQQTPGRDEWIPIEQLFKNSTQITEKYRIGIIDESGSLFAVIGLGTFCISCPNTSRKPCNMSCPYFKGPEYKDGNKRCEAKIILGCSGRSFVFSRLLNFIESSGCADSVITDEELTTLSDEEIYKRIAEAMKNKREQNIDFE